MVNELNKKSIICLGIVFIVAVLVGIGFFYYLSVTELEERRELSEEEKRELIIKKQLKELEKFRDNAEPLTEQETEEQLEELDEFREGAKPLTQEEIQKQMEELNKFR